MAEADQVGTSKAKYPSLYVGLKDLVEHSLTLISNALSQSGKWPVRNVTRVVFPNENTSDLETYQAPNIEVALAQVYSDLESGPIYGRAKRELLTVTADDPMVRALGIDMTFLWPILTGCMSDLPDFRFGESKFRNLYDQVEEYITSGVAVLRAYWELKTLGGDVLETRLSPTHRIYRLDESEVNRIWKIMAPHEIPTISGAYFPFRYWPLPGTYLLSADVKCHRKDVTRATMLLSDEGFRISTALRLSSTGTGPIQMLTSEELTFMPRGALASFRDENRPDTFSYRLDGAQSTTLMQNWPRAYELACKLKDNPDELPLHLQVAALRYSGSFEKTTNEDRLIDSAIAFEALFTKENDALSYRLPLRAAVFTSETPEERERIFQLLKAAYDLRSMLAHGQKRLEQVAKLGGKRVPIADFVGQVRLALLRSLQGFMGISQKLSKEEILAVIDKAILSMDRGSIHELYKHD